MHQALGDLDYAFAYADDILVASSDLEGHERHLRIVLQRLKEYALRLHLSKCNFGKSELGFLGYLVTSEGFEPASDRVKAITEFPRPQPIKELRRFLGMANFYRRSLPHTAEVQAPLNRYLEGSCKNDERQVEWTHGAEATFDQVKIDLANAALLSYPIINAEIRIFADASDNGMGAALEQRISNS